MLISSFTGKPSWFSVVKFSLSLAHWWSNWKTKFSSHPSLLTLNLSHSGFYPLFLRMFALLTMAEGQAESFSHQLPVLCSPLPGNTFHGPSLSAELGAAATAWHTAPASLTFLPWPVSYQPAAPSPCFSLQRGNPCPACLRQKCIPPKARKAISWDWVCGKRDTLNHYHMRPRRRVWI